MPGLSTSTGGEKGQKSRSRYSFVAMVDNPQWGPQVRRVTHEHRAGGLPHAFLDAKPCDPLCSLPSADFR
eukprot:6168779-Prymnesium_polylepis.1